MSKPPTIGERLIEQGQVLGQILEQVQATNGRVTRVEGDLYGDDAHATRGLVREFREVKGYVLDSRAVGRVLKWALPILASSNVAALAALAVKELR
jgi:hypothetical protein